YHGCGFLLQYWPGGRGHWDNLFWRYYGGGKLPANAALRWIAVHSSHARSALDGRTTRSAQAAAGEHAGGLNRTQKLANKVALVTGAGSGIGQSIAETFAKAGAFVFVADRDAKGGEETVRRISESGHGAEFVSLDVTGEEGCAAVARHVVESKG